MKKCLILIIALVLMLSLASCGKPKEVELTADNIEDYLSFEFDYSRVERDTKQGFEFGFTDLTVKTYGKVPGSFKDAYVTIEIPLTNGWTVSSNDKAYIKNYPDVLALSFMLPASGDYSTNHDLIASISFTEPNRNNVKYNITSVQGTFIPS